MVFEIGNDNLDSNKNSLFNSYVLDAFLFITVIISLVVVVIAMYTICRHGKLKSLVTRIALQQIKGADVVSTNDIVCTCKMQ